MYRFRRAINVCVFILIVALAFNPNNNPFFISEVSTFQVVKTSDTLYQEIQEKSSNYSLPPQNAYIDSVWNKTPGRNGVEVNVDESYEKMKEEGTFNE